MSSIKIYTKKDVEQFIKTRAGETKFGEKVCFVESMESFKNHSSKYVLLGIPEDIGGPIMGIPGLQRLGKPR